MSQKLIHLTEADLHNIVEDVMNGMGMGQQQPQQQPIQQQPQQQNTFQEALIKQVSFLTQKIGELYQLQYKMREQLIEQNEIIARQIQQLRSQLDEQSQHFRKLREEIRETIYSRRY